MLHWCDKGIIGCLLFLSVAIWFVPLWLYLHNRNKTPERKLRASRTLVFSGCLLFSVWCLRFAVGYYAILFPAKCEKPLYFGEELLNSFVHALQTFSMDEDYTQYIRSGKEMIAKGFGGNAIWQGIYGAYASILNVVAPVAGGTVVLVVLARFFPELHLRWSFCNTRRKKYYFSELNPASLALAKSISRERSSERPVLVFTDAYIDDEQEKETELFQEAKRYGAICVRKDLAHVPKPVKSPREFYLMDENEFGNLQTLLSLIEDQNLKYVKDSSIYLFVQTDAYIQIERQAKALLEKKKELLDGGKKPVIVPVRGYRNLVQNLLNTVPLYEPLVGRPERDDLKVTILGNGIIGTEAFLGAYWMGQMMVCSGEGEQETMRPCRLKINVVSKDTEKAFWSQIDYVNPEIRRTVAVLSDEKCILPEELLKVSEAGETNAPYCTVRYTTLDLKTGGLWGSEEEHADWLLDSDYYIVALGSDSDNITVAEKLRGLIGKRHIAQHAHKEPGQVVIAYAVFDAELTKNLNQEKHFVSLRSGKPDIYMHAFGNMDQVYSCANVYMSKNLLWKTETGSAPSYDQFVNSHRLENLTRASGELEKYENDNYDYWASLARAMHMKYRLFSLGWLKTSVFDCTTEAEYEVYLQNVREMLTQYRRFAVAKYNYKKATCEEIQTRLGLADEELQAYRELEKKRECLAWLEHRRWNAFTRTMGYQQVDVKDMLEPDKGRKDHKNMRLKLHSCLVEARMPRLEKGESYLTQEGVTTDYLDVVTLTKRERIDADATDYKVYDYYERELSNFRFEATLLQELTAAKVEKPERYCHHRLFEDAFQCRTAEGDAYLVPFDAVCSLLEKDFVKVKKDSNAAGKFAVQERWYAPRESCAKTKEKVRN
ncbi:MAG: hypothetical protein E7447_03330 [Ruminococcaceae bacterium]|nr:hypothetical protein [Oscillospiraceae bacterium]